MWAGITVTHEPGVLQGCLIGNKIRRCSAGFPFTGELLQSIFYMLLENTGVWLKTIARDAALITCDPHRPVS